jgi:hypothetical protein
VGALVEPTERGRLGFAHRSQGIIEISLAILIDTGQPMNSTGSVSRRGDIADIALEFSTHLWQGVRRMNSTPVGSK